MFKGAAETCDTLQLITRIGKDGETKMISIYHHNVS